MRALPPQRAEAGGRVLLGGALLATAPTWRDLDWLKSSAYLPAVLRASWPITEPSGMPKITAALLSIACLLVAAPAIAAECPLQEQRPMMQVEIFFGRSISKQGFVNQAEWRAFERDVIARNFARGFTVLHASGNWRDPRSGDIRKEDSELVVIVTDDTESTREKIRRVTAEYKRMFRQNAVGVFTTQGCGVF
jgi:hypothetical protein